MNPTGPIGPRSIGAFAFAVGLVVKQVLHGPARRVMHSVMRRAPREKSRGDYERQALLDSSEHVGADIGQSERIGTDSEWPRFLDGNG
jgi:hypothetical protein